MHSHRRFEDFEVPGVQECSSTLLFVQVGRGVMTVEIGGTGRILHEHSVCWSRGLIIRCDGCFVANASQCLREWDHEGPPPVFWLARYVQS